jgi:hypothetical protein
MRRTLLLPITIVVLAAVSALAIRRAFGSAWDTGMVTSPDPADSAASLRNPERKSGQRQLLAPVLPGRPA